MDLLELLGQSLKKGEDFLSKHQLIWYNQEKSKRVETVRKLTCITMALLLVLTLCSAAFAEPGVHPYQAGAPGWAKEIADKGGPKGFATQVKEKYGEAKGEAMLESLVPQKGPIEWAAQIMALWRLSSIEDVWALLNNLYPNPGGGYRFPSGYWFGDNYESSRNMLTMTDFMNNGFGAHCLGMTEEEFIAFCSSEDVFDALYDEINDRLFPPTI